MHIYNTVKLVPVFSNFLAPDEGDLSTDVYVGVFVRMGSNVSCVPGAASPFGWLLC